LLLLH